MATRRRLLEGRTPIRRRAAACTTPCMRAETGVFRGPLPGHARQGNTHSMEVHHASPFKSNTGVRQGRRISMELCSASLSGRSTSGARTIPRGRGSCSTRFASSMPSAARRGAVPSTAAWLVSIKFGVSVESSAAAEGSIGGSTTTRPSASGSRAEPFGDLCCSRGSTRRLVESRSEPHRPPSAPRRLA